jgi:hypothetical protein
MSDLAVYGGEKFASMTLAADDMRGVLEANIGDAEIGEFDLDVVGMPSGGGLSWTVPDLSGEPVSEAALEGVIVLHGNRRVFWDQDFDTAGGGTPPDCSSMNGKVGFGLIRGEIGEEGAQPKTRTCKTCPMNAWGSFNLDDDEDNRKACSERKVIFLMRKNDMLPLVVSLSPTSVGVFNKFMMRLTQNGLPCHAVIVRLKLRAEKSTGNKPYSVVVPSLVAKLSEEDAKSMADVASALKPYFDRTDAIPVTVEGEGA